MTPDQYLDRLCEVWHAPHNQLISSSAALSPSTPASACAGVVFSSAVTIAAVARAVAPSPAGSKFVFSGCPSPAPPRRTPALCQPRCALCPRWPAPRSPDRSTTRCPPLTSDCLSDHNFGRIQSPAHRCPKLCFSTSGPLDRRKRGARAQQRPWLGITAVPDFEDFPNSEVRVPRRASLAGIGHAHVR